MASNPHPMASMCVPNLLPILHARQPPDHQAEGEQLSGRLPHIPPSSLSPEAKPHLRQPSQAHTTCQAPD